MLCLVRKASECNNLNNAVKRMKEKFILSEQKCERVLEAFARFRIDPLTLPNASEQLALSGLRSVLGNEKKYLESLMRRNIGYNNCDR